MGANGPPPEETMEHHVPVSPSPPLFKGIRTLEKNRSPAKPAEQGLIRDMLSIITLGLW